MYINHSEFGGAMKIGRIINNPFFVVGLTFFTSGVWGIIWIIYLSLKLETTGALRLSYRGSYAVSHYASRGAAVFFVPVYMMVQCFVIPEKLGTKRAYINLKPKTNWMLGLLPVITFLALAFFYFTGELFFDISRKQFWQFCHIIAIVLFASEIIWLFVVQYFLMDYELERELHFKDRKLRSKKRRKRGKPLDYMTHSYHQPDLPPLEMPDVEDTHEDKFETGEDFWNDESENQNE